MRKVIYLFLFVLSLSFVIGQGLTPPDGSTTVSIFQGNLTNLSELQDTNVPSPTNGYILAWDDTNKYWEAVAPSSATDTNESTRFDALVATDCAAGTLVIGIQSNGTVLCATDNSSGSYDDAWLNETFLQIANESSLNVNSSGFWDTLDSYNASQLEQQGSNLGINTSWFSSVFDSLFGAKTTDDLTQGSTNLYDNKTFNQSLTDTLYADISVTGDNASWNETYARTIFQLYGTNIFDQSLNTTDNVIFARVNATDWSNVSITESQITDLAHTIIWDAAFNTSFGDLDQDTTYTAGSNLTLTGTVFAANITALEEYFDQLYADISVTGDNASWNETYADTKYLQSYTETDPLWTANQTNYYNKTDIESLSYYNITDFDIANYVTSTALNLTYILQSNEANLNVNSSDFWDTLDSYNGSQFYQSGDLLNLNVSWLNETLAITDTDTHLSADSDDYLFNDSTTISFNGTLLNITISQLDTDTTQNYSHLSNFTNDVGFVSSTDLNSTYARLNNNATFEVVNATNICYSDGTNCTSITDTQKKADDNYLYNDTDTIYFNGTLLNITIEQLDTDTTQNYSHLSNFTNDVGFITESQNYSHLSNFTDDLGHVEDNASWNQSYATTLFADISVVDTQKNSDGDYLFNDSTTISFNGTLLNITIDQRAGGDNASWNETYARTIFQLYGTNIFDQSLNTTDNVIFARVNATDWTNVSITESQITDLTHTVIWDAAFNTSFGDLDQDTTYTAGSNLTLSGTEFSANMTGLEEYFNTQYADISVTGDNASWNQSYADTLYILQSNEANLNVNKSNNWDTYDSINTTQLEQQGSNLGIIPSFLSSVVSSIVDAPFIKALGFVDSGEANLTYQPLEDQSLSTTDSVSFANLTSTGNISALFLYGDGSNLENLPAGTESDPLWTANQTNYYNKSDIESLSYYNITDFDIANYVTSTALNLTYILQSNEANLNVNSSDFWDNLDTQADLSIGASQITAGSFGTGNYVFDTNITTQEVVFENSASHRMYDNSTCIIIEGSTSTQEIC